MGGRKTFNPIHYLILTIWSVVVLFPVWTMLVNSLKTQLDIFRNPFAFPNPPRLEGYLYVLRDSDFLLYCWNTILIVTITIFTTLLVGSLAAFALANWKGKASKILYLLFLSGIMIPIRLGTINIFQIIRGLGLNLKENQRTLLLGVTYFFGTYQTDWTKVLVVLTLSTLPILNLYILMSSQFIKGLTAGAIKG
ncbi:MAG: carbohydrate ABC transporter permease [Firmicutes bacterium]|nr:carbohydrate ABC transporter permease [Bacillota bacterium]